MKKEENAIFNKAIAFEKSKNWHLAFADRAPREGRRFKFTTYLMHYNILAKTIIKKIGIAQTLEPGLYLITNLINDNHLCIVPKEYARNHTAVGFIETTPAYDTQPLVHVIETRNESNREVPHIIDVITYIKQLDVDLFYVTSIAGKAYYLFIRSEKRQD